MTEKEAQQVMDDYASLRYVLHTNPEVLRIWQKAKNIIMLALLKEELI